MTRKDADRRPIEALAFDVFGTVVDWRASLLKWFHDFGRERGLAADWAHLVDDWRTAYQPSMEPIRQGLRPFVTLSALHRETLDRLLVDHRLPDIGELDRQRMVRAWHTLDPWPDSVAGLTRLKRRFIIATLSNGGVGLLVDMARYAGLPWDVIFSADLFRCYKPDPSVYRGAVELLGRATDAVMMVAAHPLDLEAAGHCGLRTAFVARPAEYGPGRPNDRMPTGHWDYAVNSLEELADCLDA